MIRVGIIGAGRMGTAFARLLDQAGFALAVHSRRHDACTALQAELGCAVADTPAQLADGVDIVLGCLRDIDAIEQTYFAPTGLAAATRPAVVVELCTLGPDIVADLAARIAAAGHSFVYAAVAGLPMDVAAGRALILAAGAQPAVAAALPVLSALGRVERIGADSDAAATMKLAMNMMVFSSICSTSEALLAAERGGIARETAFDLLAGSPGAPAMLRHRREHFLDPDNARVQATIGVAAKDFAAIGAMLDRLGLNFPQATVNAAMFAHAVDAGYGDRDSSRMITYLTEQQAPPESSTPSSL